MAEDGASHRRAEAYRPPTLGENYELWEELGRGSTGAVWEAWDRQAGAAVAVKLLHPHLLTSTSAERRFLREMRIASAVRHPHSVEVKAHGRTPDGGLYLVMERLYGTTLAARLEEEGALPPRRAIHIIAQILDALAAAHDLGVVHRDLKPGNVMLIERDGDPDFVKVCDFGLAKAVARRDAGIDELASFTTDPREICGTAEYMAPEQAKGEAVDARADLYAVAVMLFQAVTGELPFRGSSALVVVSRHLTEAPPRPSALRPDLAIFPPLEKLILRALAKNRAERPSSAQVFRADLLQIDADSALDHGSKHPAWTLPKAAASDTLPAATPLRVRGSKAQWLGLSLALALFTAFLVSRGLPHRAEAVSAAPRAARPRIDASPAPVVQVNSVPAAQASTLHTSVAPVTPMSTASSAPHRPEPKKKAPSAGRTVAALSSASVVEERARADLAEAEDLLGQGHIAEACQRGREIAARVRAWPPVWRFLGRCSMRLGNTGEACADYHAYLALAPNAPDAKLVDKLCP